jgi:hypothetical protein
LKSAACFTSVACHFPDDPAFDLLRREAQNYLGAWRSERQHGASPLVLRVLAPAGEGEDYILERNAGPNETVLTVHATGAMGAAHGFHHALRLLGFGFSFFADAIPTTLRLNWPAPGNRLEGRPRFAMRGLFAYHNFLNSPTVWNLADYQRYYLTLWRWGGNCVMYHHYDAEPLAAFPGRDGTWRWGKPFETTLNNRWSGGGKGIKTTDFAHGTGRYFKDAVHGVWGAAGCFETDPIASAQAEFAKATAFARSLGIKVIFGFEMLGEPTHAQYRELLRRRIRHVLNTYPDLHTLCLWQQEGRGVTGWLSYRASSGFSALEKTFGRHFRYLLPATHRYVEAIRIAGMFTMGCELAQEIKPTVRLVVSGWGGDYWFRGGDYWRGLDRILPATVAFAAFDNLDPLVQPSVSAAIRTIRSKREAWVIPWLESDGGSLGRSSQWHPQEDLALMDKLVHSAAALGYRGCLGLHWQTAGVELSASHLLAAAWDRRLTARDYRRHYASTFFDRSPGIARQVADWMEALEALGPGWTGTGQQIECSGFSWNPHPPLGKGPLSPALAKLARQLREALNEATRLPEFKYPAMGPLTELPFAFGAHRANPKAVPILKRIRDQFARLGLSTPQARRWLATLDFVLAYERIKSSMELDGRMFALHDLLLNQHLSGLALDRVTVRAAREEVRAIECAWEQVFAAQVARLDTRGDLGNLATLNLKAYHAWDTFHSAFVKLCAPVSSRHTHQKENANVG